MAAPSLIPLNDNWLLTHDERNIQIPFVVPGDVHSALLANNLIDDPYYRNNEFSVDWVHQQQWVIERDFVVTDVELGQQCILQLDQLDCISCIYINDTLVAQTASQFIRYCFDITEQVTLGVNKIKICFDSASAVAAQKAEEFPFELPFLSWNCRIPHTNMLRKTPCHAGWDWNICLMPVGIYGAVSLQFVQSHRVDDLKFEQRFNGNSVSLDISATVIANDSKSLDCVLDVAGTSLTSVESVVPGTNTLQWTIDITSPERWWPVGSGAQTRYLFTLEVGGQEIQEHIGFREIQIERKPDEETHEPGNHAPDENGEGFQIAVNGQPIFMRGANWIPADALPARIVPETVRELLQSAVDANMNMLRVWGGGQYEPDWFYELCDEMGILVWQDFMFSCNHYPAADPQWLELVRTEATQQVRRLSKHPCLALWCGDNELVGALNWWDVTKENRDRYLANYSRLNHTLEMSTQQEVQDTDFWPSSPSSGHMDFSDGWKNDAAGDMHFWDVWHEAKPFSDYQNIHPRFCSEFGFQSFPSMPVIETFAEPADQNVSSAVMDVHQRNVGGNARIVETLVRYFEFPNSFERIVFLSQCQQAMAIKTAVEYWRCLKPHCMGTLFWQLNDTWPVASWASLEYGGGWKLLQYAARKFYQPVLVAMVPGHEKFNTAGQLQLKAVSDLNTDTTLRIEITAHTETGQVLSQQNYSTVVAADSAVLIDSLSKEEVQGVAYYRFSWSGDSVNGSNEYWLKPYKDFILPKPSINAVHFTNDGIETIELSTDEAAYFVSVDLGGNRVFSDNGFTLLPGEKKQLVIDRVLENNVVPVIKTLNIQHL